MSENTNGKSDKYLFLLFIQLLNNKIPHEKFIAILIINIVSSGVSNVIHFL